MLLLALYQNFFPVIGPLVILWLTRCKKLRGGGAQDLSPIAVYITKSLHGKPLTNSACKRPERDGSMGKEACGPEFNLRNPSKDGRRKSTPQN